MEVCGSPRILIMSYKVQKYDNTFQSGKISKIEGIVYTNSRDDAPNFELRTSGCLAFGNLEPMTLSFKPGPTTPSLQSRLTPLCPSTVGLRKPIYVSQSMWALLRKPMYT